MKRLVRFVVSSLGVAAVAVFLAAVPASAVPFVLTEWNNAAIDASTATVTVDVTEGGGNTTLVVTYQAGNFPNTLLGIDQFGYQSTANCCVAGSTDGGWSFTSAGNMDGFGNFLRQDGKGGGTDLTLTFIIAGIGLGLDSVTDFAAHLRFVGLSGDLSCSGFVGGTNIATGDTGANCGASVAEPSILALVGLGFVGLGLVSRRWRKQQLA